MKNLIIELQTKVCKELVTEIRKKHTMQNEHFSLLNSLHHQQFKSN